MSEAVRVLFMGSPAFAVPSLRALASAGHEIVAVVTQPDRRAGRGGRLTPPDVKVAAQALGIDPLQPESLKDAELQEQLIALAPDVTIVAAYGKILPRAVLAIPKRGNVNVHASLLPRWRGASPIAAAILAGDAETGVSIMEMVPRMDAGPVITRVAIPIPPDATTGSLEPELAELGAKTLVDALPRWLSGELRAVEQDESQATYCGLVRKEDGHLRAGMTATEAERMVRAFDPWPGAYVEYRGARLAIWKAHVEPAPGDHVPGATLVVGRAPAVAFREGVLVLDEVQRVGAKRIAGAQFLNGERGELPPTVGLR